MPRDVKELIPTRASLLERLKAWQDQSSWQQFFDTYWPLIYNVARGAGLTDAEAQDVVQETMVAAAKHLPTFQYDPAIGSFKGWLLTLTRWRIIDQIRKRGPLSVHRSASSPAGATGTTDAVDRVVDPACPTLDEIWEKEWQANLLQAALDNVKRRIDPQKYQIFDCYVNKEWPPEKVAGAFGVSVDYVYVAKHRITELIKDEVRRLEKEMT
jgi:RNA polymerase sigma factor (sigma-70 family)